MLILKSSSPYSLRVLSNLALLCWIGLDPGPLWKSWLIPATLGDRPMSTTVTAKVDGTVEMKNEDIPTIHAPLVTTKPIVIPPFRCKPVKGLTESLPACSY